MKAMHFVLRSTLLFAAAASFASCERRSEKEDGTRAADRMPSDQAPQGPLAPANGREPVRTNPERTDVPDPSKPGVATGNEGAVSAITQARCDRETRCNNVGDGKKYDSRADCVAKTRADWRDDLNARECPRGVVSSQLSSCVDQIKNESCDNPVQKLESVLACRSVDLCKRS